MIGEIEKDITKALDQEISDLIIRGNGLKLVELRAKIT